MSTPDESYEFCFTIAEMAVVVEALKGLAWQHSSMATTWREAADRNYAGHEREQELRRQSDEEAKAAATAYEVARIIEQRMKRIQANINEPPEAK